MRPNWLLGYQHFWPCYIAQKIAAIRPFSRCWPILWHNLGSEQPTAQPAADRLLLLDKKIRLWRCRPIASRRKPCLFWLAAFGEAKRHYRPKLARKATPPWHRPACQTADWLAEKLFLGSVRVSAPMTQKLEKMPNKGALS